MKKSKRTLTPKLRFPEFRDKGGWEKKQLGDLSEVKASGDIDTTLFSNLRSTTHLYPVYSNAVENEGLYGYYSVPQYKKNSVTITARGTLGVAFLRDHEFMGIGRLIVVSDLCGLDACFLKECWNHLALIPSEVTSIPQLTAVAVRATILPIPSFAEQQRIADCLSSLDDLISAQAKKVELLKQHKKGLMQQLFPREGETVPQLRFPEFRGKGEWEEKALGDICEILNNRRVPISSSLRTPGPYPYYGASGVVDFVDDYIFDERLVLIGEDGAKWKAFEETAFIAEGQYWVNNHAHILKPSGVIDILLANYLTMIDVGGYVTGNAPPKLTLAKLKTIPVPVSRYMKEQQRIADCLSSLDELISAQAKKVELLKQHKKGLMQQIFPAPEGQE